MIDSAMESLEISLIGREDEISRQIVTAVNEERGKMEEKERAEEEKRTKVEGQGKKS
jgi:hypothetical protein